jgi:hypothetical protein
MPSPPSLSCLPLSVFALNQALFHGHPTLLCKILGLYEAETYSKITGKKTFCQVGRHLEKGID